MGIDLALQAALAEEWAAILLGAEHVHELAAAGDELAERVGLGIRQGTWGGAHGVGKEGDDTRVEGIGLGEAARGPGEVANLPGIDDGHGQSRAGQQGGDGDFVATGGFQDDQGGAQRAHPGEQGGQTSVVRGDAKGLAGGMDVDVQVIFRDVDADEGVFHDPSL